LSVLDKRALVGASFVFVCLLRHLRICMHVFSSFETKEPTNKGRSFSLYVNLCGQLSLCVFLWGGGAGGALVCADDDVCVFDDWYLWHTKRTHSVLI